MNLDQARSRLQFLVFGDDAWRGRVISLVDGVPFISFDAHGLSVDAARKALENIVRIYRFPITLEVIHGFHRGTGIKDMLTKESFDNRVTDKTVPASNPGVTIMNIRAA